ncbi:AMP-binding protein [Alteromonas sp. a30]|uniref:AMP-binding protein n=1 Tax=Alteromonas sp. a30 TaxID=2730917 RepID=UPI0022818675|nr:AMP-binding protein [Alteromonas sp. a30]MCY7294984.1 AMP-binding protein [Alteromonas sp. a30]
MKVRTLISSLVTNSVQNEADIAVVTDEKSWTYGEFAYLISKYKVELEKQDFVSQIPVAVTARKTVDTLALMIALGDQGHTPLVVSPDLGAAVKPKVFSQAGISIELAAESVSGNATISVTSVPSEDTDAELSQISLKDSPLMLTTSGTTGLPKVVCLSEASVIAFFAWAKSYFDLKRSSRVLSYAPLNFDLSLLDVWATLSVGGSVVFVEPSKATNSNYLATLVKETKPTVIQGVPMMFTLLCDGNERLGDDKLDVEHILVTGDVTPKQLRKRMAAMYPSSKFHNVYGCTETNDSFIHTSVAEDFSAYEQLPLGTSIEGSTFRVVDQDGELKTQGAGELHTSTPFLAQGYTDKQKTLSAFYWDDAEKRRYYRTGDMVTVESDGAVLLQGRSDHIVKVRGVRTNLRDIEHVLDQFEQIEESVVFSVPDEVEGVILHAAIKTTKENKPSGFSLRVHCSENLPLTSVPQRFHFFDNPLPRTSTGKPDRKAIQNSIQSQEV